MPHEQHYGSAEKETGEIIHSDESPYFRQRIVRTRDSVIDLLEVGKEGGTPILFFHGLPDSKHHARAFAAMAHKLGIRVIAPNMYGFGKSKTNAKVSIEQWNADVQEMLQQLGINKPESVGSVGISGGGMLSIVSTQIPQVAAVGAMNTVGTFEMKDKYDLARREMKKKGERKTWIQYFNIGRVLPLLISKLYVWVGTKHTMKLFRRGAQGTPEGIQQNYSYPFLEELQASTVVIDAIAEYRSFCTGMLEDLGVMDSTAFVSILHQPWKKIMESIQKPVELVYGDEDWYLYAGRTLETHIPGVREKLVPYHGGHLPPKEEYRKIFEHVRDAVIKIADK
jgi:pimeloyl-ACP methyl ester carboxylesterase